MRKGNFVRDYEGHLGRILFTFPDEITGEGCACVDWGNSSEDMFFDELELTPQAGDRVRGNHGEGRIIRIQIVVRREGYVACVEWDEGFRSYVRMNKLELA